MRFKTIGEKNNNPGRLTSKGVRASSDDEVCHFPAPVEGVEALAKALLGLGQEEMVGVLVRRWFGGWDHGYVSAICQRMCRQPEDRLNLENSMDLTDLVTAIIHCENGRVRYSVEEIEDGVDAALGV